MKVIEIRDEIFAFKCPGCKCDHHFTSSWQFNGDFENPTVSPSILTRFTKTPDTDPSTWTWNENPGGACDGSKKMVCHVFIKDGMIQFLSDCTHELAGKTVPMESVDA